MSWSLRSLSEVVPIGWSGSCNLIRSALSSIPHPSICAPDSLRSSLFIQESIMAIVTRVPVYFRPI